MSSLAASAAGKAPTGAGLRIVGAQQGGTARGFPNGAGMKKAATSPPLFHYDPFSPADPASPQSAG